MQRLAVDATAVSPDVLRPAIDVIGRGGVVAFPTDTLYGLAVDPFNASAVDRLFAVKGRSAGQAIALVAADLEQVERWLGPLSKSGRRLATAFWPGPLTILVFGGRAGETGRSSLGAGQNASRVELRLGPGITAEDGTVGVRVPNHAIARALCVGCGRPLTATSANLSGQAPTADPDEVAWSLADRIDLLLDAGPTPGGPASTIVNAAADELTLVRAGAIDWDTIQRCASRG